MKYEFINNFSAEELQIWYSLIQICIFKATYPLTHYYWNIVSTVRGRPSAYKLWNIVNFRSSLSIGTVSLIGLHSWAGLSIAPVKDDTWISRASEKVKERRKRNIEHKKLIIIDEVSMLNKSTLCCASQVATHVKNASGETEEALPFGGMHVILSGDFHQFPPVRSEGGALYHNRPDTDSARALLGRELFLQFDVVVMLTEQVRVKDKVWTSILNRLRTGDCTDEDIEEINKLVLNNDQCPPTDFTTGPWRDAILVTTRHSVREEWNKAAIRRHCFDTGHQRYIWVAEDTEKEGDGPLSKRARLALAKLDEKKTGKLQDLMEAAVGMKAMVVLNLATEADIANGTRGTITDIVLDPRENGLSVDDEGAIRLKYPPALIKFRPNKGSNINFEGLDEGIVPIIPSVVTFKIKFDGQEESVRRRQYAMTAGYAFTDYKAQGQTIEYVIIDIAQPPNKGLTAFSAYVALSRSRGRQSIRLLRPFDENLFMHHPSEDLRIDMQRLVRLDENTRNTHSA